MGPLETRRAQSKDQLAPTLSSAHRAFSVFTPRGHSPLQDSARARAIDSIPTFSGEFRVNGIGPTGAAQHRWFYTMAGAQPERGGTSTFDAPIIPVSLDLLDYDGSVRVVNGRVLHYSLQPFVNGVVNSPIFQNTEYSSSDVLTQFGDQAVVVCIGCTEHPPGQGKKHREVKGQPARQAMATACDE